MDIDTVIQDLQAVKPVVRHLPAEAGLLAEGGIDIAVLIATFIKEEQHTKTLEAIKSFLRSGGQGIVQERLDELYPNG